MKTLFVNIAIFCILWVFIHLAMIVTVQVGNLLPHRDATASLPNYKGYDWIGKHIAEFRKQRYEYWSFVGWRRYPYKGETINVDENGLRRTVDRTPNGATKRIAFFGGSTTWGTGVSDEFTIPSYFASLTHDYLVTNYGEAAYTAHQGLETLIKLLESGGRPDIVVFYDGVNDVKYKCLKEHTWYSHGREQEYRSKIELNSSVFSFSYLLSPLRTATLRFKQAFATRPKDEPKTFNCDKNHDKAEHIATALIEDWKIAKALVEFHGGRFFAFLQPVSYFSKTKLDLIPVSEELKAQFKLIYPMIKSNLDPTQGFYDMTDVFDRDEYIYIDYAHVSPNGNRYAAERILSIIDASVGDRASGP